MPVAPMKCPTCGRSLERETVVDGRVECPGCGALCDVSQPEVRSNPTPVRRGGNTDPEDFETEPPTPGGRTPVGLASLSGVDLPEDHDFGDESIDAFAPSGGVRFEPLPPGWVPPFSRDFLERHTVVGLLGKGAMGAVYLMTQTKLGRQVAVKVVREDVMSKEEAHRLEKEARVLASLNHPNVTSLYDVGIDHGRPYMVCEFVEGMPLSKRLQEKPQLTLVQTIKIIAQILDGLMAAHKKGIIHRDLKPGNILLTAQSKPKIGDFGLAHSHTVASGTLVGRIVGTPPYMSPEQCRGGATSVSSDIYSVGVMLFEMAAGRRPFLGPDVVDYLTQHTMHPPPPIRTINPSLPEGLERICAKALAKDPARRFDSASSFRKELVAFFATLASANDTPAPRELATPVPPMLLRKPGELTEGTLLGKRYRVLRLLGEGGMGQVWLAADEALDGTEVALKILPTDLWRDPEARETLKQEAKLSQKLAHPNIVRLMTLEPGEPSFLVMEYISGPTLSTDLANRKRKSLGPYHPTEALPYIEGIASGLDHAHSKNLVHRDLKPSNVMLDPQPDGSFVAKLADFGIAAELTNYRTRRTGAVPAGTLAYMSPEQLACQKLDGRADVYSLGATLYQMLTLQPPFVGGDIAWAIKNEPVPEPADVPAPVVAVLMSALAKNRHERPSSAGELAARLRDACHEIPAPRPGIGIAVADQPWITPEERSRASATGLRRPTPRPFDLVGPAPAGGAPVPVGPEDLRPWTIETYVLALLAGGGFFALWLQAGYFSDGAPVGRVIGQLALAAAALVTPCALLWIGSEHVRRWLVGAHTFLIPVGLVLFLKGRPMLSPWTILGGLAGVYLLTREGTRAFCRGAPPELLRPHRRHLLSLIVGPLLALGLVHGMRVHMQTLAPARLPSALWVADAAGLGPRTTSRDGSFDIQPPAGWTERNAADGSTGWVYTVGAGTPLAALSARRVRTDLALPGDIAGARKRLEERRRRFQVQIERAGVVYAKGTSWVEVAGTFAVRNGARAFWYLETVRGGARYEIEFYGLPGFIAANRGLWSDVLASLSPREEVAAGR